MPAAISSAPDITLQILMDFVLIVKTSFLYSGFDYFLTPSTAAVFAVKPDFEDMTKTEKAINSLYEDYTSGIIEEDDYRRFYKNEVERRINI